MLAHLQQLMVASVVLAATAWGAIWSRNAHAFVAIVGVVAIVFGYAVLLAVEFGLMWAINRAEPSARARPNQVFSAWWSEVLAMPRVFAWAQPFREHVQADNASPGSGLHAVLLVHGFVCNRALWNRWMQRLRGQHVPFIGLSLEPVFGSIDAYVAPIDAAVRRLAAVTGRPVVIAAHSMGGLAIRAWMATCKDSDELVRHVITMGTPHHGTFLARWALSRNAREMRVSGEWLRQLAAREPDARYGRFTCYYSHCDNIVFPAHSATLAGADNRHLNAAAHVAMLERPEIFDELLRWVRPK